LGRFVRLVRFINHRGTFFLYNILLILNCKKKLNGPRDTLDTLQIISFDQHGCFDTRSIKWLEKLTDRSTVNKFLSQISFVFAYGLGAVCYAAELRRLIMISDDSMKNHYQQQLNKLWKIGKVREGSKK
jgi:hypothetical protein